MAFEALVADDEEADEVELVVRLVVLADAVALGAAAEEVKDAAFVDVADESSLSSWVFFESEPRLLVLDGFLCCWDDRPPAASEIKRMQLLKYYLLIAYWYVCCIIKRNK